MCYIVDQQIANELLKIQIDPELLPHIRDSYTDEIARKLGHLDPSESDKLEKALRTVDEEEARMARLFASGKITEKVWDHLWTE